MTDPVRGRVWAVNAAIDEPVIITAPPPRRHAAPPSSRRVAPPLEPAPRPRRSAVVGVLLGVTVLLALLVTGMLAPGIPVLGIAGASASAFVAWLVALAAVVTVVAAVTLMRHGSVTRVVATVLGLAALGGGVVVGWQQLSVAREHAVAVDVGALFAVVGSDAEPDTFTSYGEHDGEPLELSMWEPAGGTTPEPAPVVVLVHAGGGALDPLQPSIISHAAWFAEQGYLAVSLEYPLSDDEHHQWDLVEPRVACALTWVEQHAAEHGGDAGRIFLVGDSMGGNVALQVAYRGVAGDLESSCGGSVPAVDAVSTLYPVASPADFYANPDPVLGGVARDAAIAYTGGTPAGVPERYTAITPAEHLTGTAPATLMVTGAADHLVPPGGAGDLAAALDGVDVPHELVLLPAGEHGFDRAPSGVGTQVWRELTLQWFEQHGRAPAAP